MDRRPRGLGAAATGLFAVLLAACQAVPASDGASGQTDRFAVTGVVEGFYGPPWSHQDRLDLLAFMGRVGLGAYFYAPKNDPYHRDRWRDPYPPEERERLQELIHTAQRNAVDFWYAISPGLTMTYSSQADYQGLIAKIDSVGRLGVRHIGLFLDDVSPNLTNAADRERFASLADAHIALINRLHDDLGSRGMALSVTPTTYSDAWGDPEYVVRLGAGVNPGVPFFWTGPDIASQRISAADASDLAERAGRAPFIWDNYPVNDFARWRLFLGPVRERTADLAAAAAGFVANPMNEAHASMIPLHTIAAYTRNPKAYDPAAALDSAVQQLYGPDAALALQPFIEIYGDDAWGKNVFEPLQFLPNEIDLEPMRTGIAQLERSLDVLRSLTSAGTEQLAPLVRELEPFVQRTRARIAQLASDARYENRGGHLLFYRTELDRITVSEATRAIRVDGETSEWGAEGWRPLTASRTGTERVRLAATADDDRVYFAIDVPISASNVREGPHMGEGDHIALVIDADPQDGRINETDLFVLAPAPGETPQSPLILSMGFAGFMAKFLADNEGLTFNEFHVSTFGRRPHDAVADLAGLEYRTQRTRRGYTAELAVPRGGRDRIRFSLTVTATQPRRTVFSVAQRNYPASPESFAELIVEEPR